jgi:iron complex transport system permease protein
VYGLAWRQGMHGDRLVLVGIALGYALAAVTSFLISRVGNMEALSATAWLAGSLNGRGWEHVRPVAVALLVLLPVVWVLSRRLRALELAEETSATLGVSVERTRFGLFVVATLLAAVATASAGPVAFIALMAPQAARRVTGAAGAGLIAAGLMGAVILLIADVTSQVLLPDTDLPVGIVTGVIGGVYLASLIARRRGSA